MATKPTMWCPGCAEHHPCGAVRPFKDRLLMKMFGFEEKPGGLTNPNGHYPANGLGAPEVRWFERYRRCKNCGQINLCRRRGPRQVVKPLIELRTAVDHAVSGNYEIEFELQGEGELVNLARSIRNLISHARLTV